MGDHVRIVLKENDMHGLAANRGVLPLLFAASAFALTGVIPLACAAEESVRPADRSILLAADQPSAPLAQRWPMWTEAPARSKKRPAPALIRAASRSDLGHRRYAFVGVGFGF